jgi:cytochrome bd ubiquinol oxidase subunit II
MSAETIAIIWALLLAVGVFLYVCMDGFDLGIGILSPLLDDDEQRDTAVNSVAPVWDGNETWLVLGGGGLFAVFPLAYATILPALYMPLILMLLGLTFRGVAFEMRFRGRKRLWDRSFTGGSLLAGFCQGIALGALVQGIEVQGRAYAGGWWDWLTPFSAFTGAMLVVGYALLGACWLIWKTEGELQARARRLARPLAFGLLAGIVLVSLMMPFLQPTFRARWFTFPAMLYAAPVPLLVAVLGWRLVTALIEPPYHPLRHETTPRTEPHELMPFLCTLGLFLLSYAGLGISLWPMIVPPTVTIWDAAAPRSTQAFLLVGAVVLIPIILIYTGYVYWLFRGKVRAGQGYH